MANTIKPKRSNTASKVPNTSELVSGELGVNMADKKVYINNGTAVVQVGAGVLSALGDVTITSPTTGQGLSWNGTAWVNASGAGSGDVTGAASSTDNAITRFDGTTGKVIQNSTVTLDDTGNIVSANSVQFGLTPTVPTVTGAMYWDSGNKSPTINLDTDVALQLGQENVALVYNGTGVTITNGSVVAVSGAQGQRPSVSLADADSEALSAPTLGIATEDIANGAEGFVTTFGFVRGINTSAFTAGAPIYLSQTAGQFTATRPSAPAHTVALGWVIKVNASSGEVFVNINNGWELDELHNVLITSAASGNTLIYDAVAGVWENANITAGTGISVTNGAGSITIAATNAGTVTSVTGTSPVASTGGATPAISLSAGYGDTQNPYASKTANFVLAAPNGTAGVPTFRAIVAADIPTLNQSTTGNAATATSAGNLSGGSITGNYILNNATSPNTVYLQFGDNTGWTYRFMTSVAGTPTARFSFVDNGNFTAVGSVTASNHIGAGTGLTGTATSLSIGGNAANVTGTVAIANGGTGATTNTAARTNLGATTVGSNFFTLTNPSAITFPRMNADNTVSSLDAATFRTAIGAGTGSGTVTSVTGTAPVVSSGGATPAISMAAATTSVNGYLTSTDWNTFNGKQAALGFTPYNATNPSNYIALASAITGYTVGTNTALAATDTLLAGLGKIQGQINARGTGNGTVTSVAALTLGTTGTDLSSTVATGTTTPVITLQVPTASATNRGALSAADWTTFNNKTSNTGTVTSVGGTGTVSGLTLTGTVTTSGNLTLGGNLSITADMIYQSFTATASQTTFTPTTAYTSGKIDVFANGIKMVNGSDVTVTSGTSVVFATGVAVNTRVDLVYPI
jgi:hypothetical protein